MAANLLDLLSDGEIEEIERSVQTTDRKRFITRYTNVYELTVKQLSEMSFILLKSKYSQDDRLPPMILSAEAIKILVERAEKKNIGIF